MKAKWIDFSRSCPNCNEYIPKYKRVCPNCKTKVLLVGGKVVAIKDDSS